MDKPPVEFALTQPSSPDELEACFRLRWRLLRAPWSQPPGSERDELDETAHHVCARISSGELVAVGRLHFRDAETAQIRYVATAERYRGLGIGRAIVERLEQLARDRGATVVILNARESAVPFYERLGYAVCGDGPTLYGVIGHNRMIKMW
jgi:predicted GNAT family N-acyltransferase